MNLDDYQKQAYKFAVYPETNKIIYPALGLCNEAGELCGKVKKWLRGDYEELPTEAIADELGDVLWYLAALCTDCGHNMSSDLRVGGTFNLKGSTMPLYGDLPKEVIELANAAAQASLFPNWDTLSNVLIHCHSISLCLDIPLETIAQRNLAKLLDRESRGVIKGDGDER